MPCQWHPRYAHAGAGMLTVAAEVGADHFPGCRHGRWRRGPTCGARVAAVISSPDLGVFAVTAARALCAFPYVVDALPEQCLRRRPGTFPFVAAVFRTKWLLPERCSATCLRRRRPGQMQRRQGRLQITAVLYWNNPFGTVRWTRAERHFLSRWLSSGECAAKFSSSNCSAWSRQI